MVFGGPGLARELRDAGLRTVGVTATGLAAHPDAIAVGVDFSLSYGRLSIAAEVVRRGAYFAVTNRDPVFPSETGLKAGAGAIVAALVVAGGREPDLVVGKPQPGLFLEASRVARIPAPEAVVIGDGLFTDIPAAHAVGARSVLMLTGVSNREQVELLPPAARPTAVAADAEELSQVLVRLARG
jgi:ribonucleotide monophosphatase NagD (HAD superfamily)